MVDNNYDIFVLVSAITFNNYLAALRKLIADLLVSPAGGKRWCSCFYCIGCVFCILLGLNSAEQRVHITKSCVLVIVCSKMLRYLMYLSEEQRMFLTLSSKRSAVGP